MKEYVLNIIIVALIVITFIPFVILLIAGFVFAWVEVVKVILSALF